MCRTFSVRHTETTEHIETYQMCCTLIVCVALLTYVSLTRFGECAAARIHCILTGVLLSIFQCRNFPVLLMVTALQCVHCMHLSIISSIVRYVTSCFRATPPSTLRYYQSTTSAALRLHFQPTTKFSISQHSIPKSSVNDTVLYQCQWA